MRTRVVFFAVSLLLTLSSISWAQCIATVVDYGCDLNNSNCSSLQNCSSTTFSVQTSGYYCLKVGVKCSPKAVCKYCQVCGEVYNGNTHISNSHRTNCGDASDCTDDNCEHGGRFYLTTGITYTLYACLTTCSASCDNCPSSSGCEAVAAVHPEFGSTCEI
jgi:hypothetical protein